MQAFNVLLVLSFKIEEIIFALVFIVVMAKH